MQTLIKTLTAENGKLFAVIGGRRVSVSSCPIEVEIYEVSLNIPVLGIVGYEVKLRHAAEVHCDAKETSRAIDEIFLKNVSRFEVVGDLQRADGKFERIIFDSLRLAEIDLFRGIWVLSVEDQTLVRRLVEM